MLHIKQSYFILSLNRKWCLFHLLKYYFKFLSFKELQLPYMWDTYLSRQDQIWMAKNMFRPSKGPARVELTMNKIWWYAPQPAVICNEPPTPNRYFTRDMFLWMPFKFFEVILCCINPACENNQLQSAGIHKRVRQVLDVDKYYNMGTEVLHCNCCSKKYLSWSSDILQQLDRGHQSYFSIILTQR